MAGRTACLAAAGCVALALAAPCVAAGADLRGALPVHTRITARCAIHGADLDFGVYSEREGARGETVLEVRCTPGVKARIGLDSGQAGDAQARKMSGPAELTYHLFRDVGRIQPFGDRSAADMVALDADGRWQRVPVYGVAPPGQALPAGSYRDVVAMTVTY